MGGEKANMTCQNLVVLIRGAGEMATGVAYRLYESRLRVCLLEIAKPLAVRRTVCFSEAVYDGEKEVEGLWAKLVTRPDEIPSVWMEKKIPVVVDPDSRQTLDFLKPDVVVDAILAKRNLGTKRDDAPLVIGLGPGFSAGTDVHAVIETNRGHHLGRVILKGEAEPDTGIPGEIGGYSAERVLRTMKKGVFRSSKSIGDQVSQGTVVAVVDDSPVIAQISGMVRGLIRDGADVKRGTKVGDIDPRGKKEYCFTISEKARAIGGGVLEVILHQFNQ
jgi:xanthine dehydrogenase accessory factor